MPLQVKEIFYSLGRKSDEAFGKFWCALVRTMLLSNPVTLGKCSDRDIISLSYP